MANIINEIPEELKEDETTEVELESQEDKQDYEEAVKAKKEETKPKKETKQEEFDFEIEEEDDTPPEDRNREPLPDGIKEELEADTLDDYSDRVKTRMAQLKKAWHDERRAKEKEVREREEAIKYAQHIIAENQRLKSTLSAGEKDYVETLKNALTKDIDIAKREYREAYDSGDSEKIIEAQTKLNEAQFKLQTALGRKPLYQQVEMPLQEPQNQAQSSQQNNIPKPDSRALVWQEKNTWFGQDEEMTSLALGLHEKLVRSGVDPSSEEYYRRIDDTMQKRFPEYFGETDTLEGQPAQRTKKPSTVVAPATRSTSPKKVRLTKTQLALAKKFKLTPEQYARELLKTENANG